MKNKRKEYFPRAMLKNLAQDITKLMTTKEGRMFALELLEEIPYDLRSEVVEGLSSFYKNEMIYFFQLLKLEYGKELEACCDRALEKYKMAGIDISEPLSEQANFYKAYATRSRHSGHIAVDVAWEAGGKGVYLEGFYLTFNPDGVYNFFIVEDMPLEEYEDERGIKNGMIEISFEETCLLIQEAYNFNVRYMSRPALGKFLYQKYLDNKAKPTYQKRRGLIRKLSDKLTPRQLVHSVFYALKYQDSNYVNSLWFEPSCAPSVFWRQFKNITQPGAVLLEGQVKEIHGSSDMVEVNAYAVSLVEGEVYLNDYKLSITKDENCVWLIADVVNSNQAKLSLNSKINPFTCQVFCRVYEIIDMDELFDILDDVDNIREVEELTYGMHMRVTSQDDDLNYGVSLLTGVIADLVINGDEFVVIAQEHSAIIHFDDLLSNSALIPVEYMGEYEVSLISAFSYLAGQYTNFEDVLLENDNDLIFEDGMKFITARYLVKDRQQVLERLEQLADIQIKLQEEFKVFYQTETICNEMVFRAEYVMGPTWVTVSTFGEKDMNQTRHHFEHNLYDCLEFDGMELREEGIFDILTGEVKKQYPELEAAIKEMYINKWYYSGLTILRGMSPSEACQTEEGTRLLWTMFKKIKQKEKRRCREGVITQVNLKEYIRKVQLKKEGRR